MTTLADAMGAIPDGASVAVTKFNPMEAVRELIRQQRTGLHVIGVPTAGFAVDLLIAAGCVGVVETGAFVLGSHGSARNHLRAVEDGHLRLIESACPLIEMQLRAGAAGFSFTPILGLFGSDMLSERPELKVIDDPYDPDFEVVIAPSLRPDFAIIHALRGDRDGNVVITIHNEDRLIVQAAGHAIVTVEEIRDDALGGLAADEQVIPGIYFDAVVVAPGGARPLACPGHYSEDLKAVEAYIAAAKSADSMARYVEALRSPRKANADVSVDA
jgi:glutaconate CoA-transferase, subunit A